MGYLKSPLNYVGGKYKLLKQLLPLFPDDIDIFVDMFAGGLDVSLNVEAGQKRCNDIMPQVIDFYLNVQCRSGDIVHGNILKLVDYYKLSKENQDGFLKLRNDYNRKPSWYRFYALVAHSFSHQIRFNSKGQFNMPFGKDRSCYNEKLQERLTVFADTLDDTYTFTSLDFRQLELDDLTENSFVYCDPPYLITTATYNESGGWTDKDEKDLLGLLDTLDSKGIKFGLSNVTEMGGRKNELLIEWARKYTLHELNFNYSNSNYHKKEENRAHTREVYVTNFVKA